MTLTDRIEELARLIERRKEDRPDGRFILVSSSDAEAFLPVLRAAAAYAKYREAMSLERLVAAVEEATRE